MGELNVTLSESSVTMIEGMVSTMAGPTTEVYLEDLKGLRAEVHSIRVSLAGLRAEVGLAKWLFGIVAGAMLASIAAGIWWAATMSADARNLDARLGKVESKLEGVDARLDKVDARLDKLQSSIDGLAAAIRDQPPRVKGAIARELPDR